MDTLVSGTKEYLLVPMADRLGLITDLTTLTPNFDVLDKDDTVKINALAAAVANGMTLKCLIDTTNPTNWVSGIYRLYVRFTAAPEVPVHGPFPFKVEVR